MGSGTAVDSAFALTTRPTLSESPSSALTSRGATASGGVGIAGLISGLPEASLASIVTRPRLVAVPPIISAD